jgi:SAM-dependent methyltransferase
LGGVIRAAPESGRTFWGGIVVAIDPQTIADRERETWNRCAEVYANNLLPLTRQGYQLITDAGFVRQGVHLLDIGCGPGDFTRAFSDAGALVTGVDFSSEMIRVAQDRFPEIEFKEADAERLPFDDCSFDVVVGAYLVHHLARPDAAFQEIYRVVKPGGRFVFVIPIQESQASFGSFFSAVGEHHEQEAIPGGPLLLELDTAVHKSMLATAGFAMCEIERREVTCELESLEPLLRGGWEIGGLSSLPKPIQAAIEATTLKNAEPYWTKDRYRFPDSVFFGSATRS